MSRVFLGTHWCKNYRKVFLSHRKGDLGTAVKQLELYVEVADGAGPQSMARACSAIGTMYNTLVSHSLQSLIPRLSCTHSLYLPHWL